jgi:hypothetical protein
MGQGDQLRDLIWGSKWRFFMGQQTLLGQDLLIIVDSRLHSVGHTTFGRIPLDEWSIRCRDLYLTKHNTQNRQTSMPPVKFEPIVPASERTQTHALDRAATGTGKWRKLNGILLLIIRIFWRFLYSKGFIQTEIWKSWHIGTSYSFIVDRVVIFSELPYCASCLIIERSGGWKLQVRRHDYDLCSTSNTVSAITLRGWPEYRWLWYASMTWQQINIRSITPMFTSFPPLHNQLTRLPPCSYSLTSRCSLSRVNGKFVQWEVSQARCSQRFAKSQLVSIYSQV